MAVLAKGADAIEMLAKRFPQLYVAPARDLPDEQDVADAGESAESQSAQAAREAHRRASGLGIAPENATLEHFVGNAEDELREVDTPAGPVEVLFLKERADFETFLQIIGHKSQAVPIARTVGAITYRGLADWGAVAAERDAYLAAGGDDWSSEFARLAKQPGMFRAELIVISEGPYSNVSAEQAGYDEGEWVRLSREIRLHHECAHVVCRRTMPDDVAPVWDEVTADVTGLLCATGGYDAALAAKFLGVSAAGFVDGRLLEYLHDDQQACIDDIAAETYRALLGIEETVCERSAIDPFEFLLDLKRHPLLAY